MARKADLLEAARSRGLNPKPSATIAELEKLLASDPNQGARNASRENPCHICGRRNPHVHNL
jgi:hypothetical protein